MSTEFVTPSLQVWLTKLQFMNKGISAFRVSQVENLVSQVDNLQVRFYIKAIHLYSMLLSYLIFIFCLEYHTAKSNTLCDRQVSHGVMDNQQIPDQIEHVNDLELNDEIGRWSNSQHEQPRQQRTHEISNGSNEVENAESCDEEIGNVLLVLVFLDSKLYCLFHIFQNIMLNDEMQSKMLEVPHIC